MKRPGVKTSEFWVAVIAMGLGAVMEITGIDIDPSMIAGIFGPPAAYIVARGLAKMGRVPGE